MLRQAFLYLVALGVAACSPPADTPTASAPGDVPAAGVPLELAEHRDATVSKVVYELKLDIPADIEADIDGEIKVRFDLSDRTGGVALDFREDGDKLRAVAVNGAENGIHLPTSTCSYRPPAWRMAGTRLRLSLSPAIRR